MEVGWYVYQKSTSWILPVGRHQADQCIQGKYAFLLSRVFKINYTGVISTKKCPWDDLSSNRTRKNILLEIQNGKKKNSSCNFLCMVKSLSFSADINASCTHTETLLAPGKSSESNGFLSQERERT